MSVIEPLSAQRPAPGNPRRTEGWALLEAARRLDEARKARTGEAVLGAAQLNWRLWTIFQASLSDSHCGLPDDLRVKMLSLANFIDRRSAEIIADPKPELLDALVRINLEVGGGMLNASGADAGRVEDIGGEEKRARVAG